MYGNLQMELPCKEEKYHMSDPKKLLETTDSVFRLLNRIEKKQRRHRFVKFFKNLWYSLRGKKDEYQPKEKFPFQPPPTKFSHERDKT